MRAPEGRHQQLVLSLELDPGTRLRVDEELLHSHGGSISVEANQPQGSIFVVRLPS